MAVQNLYLFYFSVKKIKIKEKMKTKGTKKFTKYPCRLQSTCHIYTIMDKSISVKQLKYIPTMLQEAYTDISKQKPTKKVD